ncbi:MAG: hypothetical protein ACOCW6_02220 [Spirochaetota bacterium]
MASPYKVPDRDATYRGIARRYADRLGAALHKESLGRSLLKLAWTAGPVTYLGLHAGYRIGFGSEAPPQLFIYFAAYTVIAGLISVGMRVAYRTVRGERREEVRRKGSEILDKLIDLVPAVRNAILSSYDPANRSAVAGLWILQNPDAGETSVEMTVRELTGSKRLGEAIREIESYRRLGMSVLVRSRRETVAPLLEGRLTEVARKSPALAELIRRRFAGLVTVKSEGWWRTEGFLERVFAAGEEDNLDLMTLTDVEEVVTLTFELLAGRRIPLASVRYSGSMAFIQAFQRLQEARRNLRQAIRVRNGRLRVLAERLNDHPYINRVAAAIPSIASVNEVSRNVLRALADIHKSLARPPKTGFGKRRSQVDQKAIDTFRRLVRLYGALYSANLMVRKRYVAFRRNLAQYDDARRRSLGASPAVLNEGEEGPGIRITKRYLGLDESQRTDLVEGLAEILRSVEIRDQYYRAVTLGGDQGAVFMSNRGYRHLALEIAFLLDRIVGLGRSELQYAVEGSPATNLGILELGLTRDVKVGWALAMVGEIQEDMTRTIRRLLQGVVYYHGISLSEESAERISREFGVDPEALRGLLPREDGRPEPLTTNIQNQLLDIPPIPPEYRSLVGLPETPQEKRNGDSEIVADGVADDTRRYAGGNQ